jgi:hypothetical protein
MANTMPPQQLRDIMLMWIYAAVSTSDQIQNGKLTPDALQKQLNGHVVNNKVNQDTLNTIYKFVANDGQGVYSQVQSDFLNIPYFNRPTPRWPGPGPTHPDLPELDSIFQTFSLGAKSSGKGKKTPRKGKK